MRRLRRSQAARTAAALLSGAALGASFWPGAWGLGLWAALLPLWPLTQDRPPLEAFLWGWLYGCAAWGVGIWWFLGAVLKFVPGQPAAAWAIYLVILAGMGSMFAVAAWGVRSVSLGLRRWCGWHPAAAFLAAAVPGLVVMEGFYPELFRVSFAASQLWHLPFLQSADLAGTALVEWVMALWAAAAPLLLRRGAARRLARPAVAAAVVLAGANELYGLWRIADVGRRVEGLKAEGKALRAGVVQGSVPEAERFVPARLAANMGTMAGLTRAAADRGAKVVVWPENSYERDAFFSAADRRYADPRAEGGEPLASHLAADVPVPVDVLLGARVLAGRRHHYGAVFRRADGSFGGLSAKRFPTPFGEFIPGGRWLPGLYRLAPFLLRIHPGPQPVLTLSDGTRLGAFICYDATVPRAPRDLARAGATVLAELTSNAWWFDQEVMPAQTLGLSRMRAIENRRYILRALTTGVSAVISPTGRVLQAVPVGARGLLVDDVVPLDGLTPAARLGDAAYWAGALWLGGLLIFVFFKSGRGPVSWALTMAGLELPQPRPGVGEACRFAAPNEEAPADALPILRRAPRGLYVAVGAERGFLAACGTPGADGLALVDADAGVCRYNAANIALLAASADRADYLRRRHDAGADAWWRRTLAYRPAGSPGERFRCRSFAALDRGSAASGPFAGVHYLSDDDLFGRLRSWARAGRIAALQVDLADGAAWARAVTALSALGPLAVLDVSNAWQPEYMRPASFARVVEAAQAWAAPESVLLVTSMSPPHRWPGRGLIPWDYRGYTFRSIRARGDRLGFVRDLSWAWAAPRGVLSDAPPVPAARETAWALGPAGAADVAGVAAVLDALADDPALLRRPEAGLRRAIGAFTVARAAGGAVVGCAALEAHGGRAEVATVAVLPSWQGRGLGAALVAACGRRAKELGFAETWLATTRPDFFSALGYVRFCRWTLPPGVLLAKAARLAAQPPGRWAASLTARFTFMKRPT